MTVAIATTLLALAINAVGLLVLEAGAYRASQLAQARTLADIVARAVAAAVSFNDRKEGAEALEMLRENPAVLAAAAYTAKGELFAAYEPAAGKAPPRWSGNAGLDYAGNRIEGFNRVVEKGAAIGAVYLSVYNGWHERMLQYAGVLAAVLVVALAGALVLSSVLQRSLMRPIHEVTHAARRVVEDHDYSVRMAHRADDETGVLSEAFNQMLAEIDRRAKETAAEVHERRQAEEALRTADQRKDEFLATLAHELRNPLAPIRNAVSLLKLQGSPEGGAVWAREVIDRQAAHMARLLDDLLDVGRISRGRLELRKERLSLASVVEAAVETSRPAIEGARHSLSIELPEEPVALDGDPVRLSQVFSNLLNNACKYTDPGGRLALRARVEAGDVVVSVCDDGIGMAPQTVEALFHIFSQAAPAMQRSQGGLGIGLFLVRSLVELHGGSVTARSAGIGKGSEFTVRLPASTAPPATRAEVRDGAGQGGGTLRVLVADDNRDAAESLAALFKVLGHDVRVVHDGLEAVREAAAYRPQLVVLDIGMPGMNGYEAAGRIREQAAERKVVLAALTGWGQETDRQRATDAGFDRHLTKPVTMEQLAALLGMARRQAA